MVGADSIVTWDGAIVSSEEGTPGRAARGKDLGWNILKSSQ